jgi:hypothetical protein
MGSHFEKGDFESIVLLCVYTFLLAKRKALRWSKSHPGCCRQLKELKEGWTVKLISFDKFYQV